MKKIGAIFVLAVLLAATPTSAPAQDAVLYEVGEMVKILGGRRLAQSTLLGWVGRGSAICPNELAQKSSPDGETCELAGIATDDMDIESMQGAPEGMIAVVVQDRNPADAAEVVQLEIRFQGQSNLAPVLSGVPIGSVSGTWTAVGTPGGLLESVTARGSFTGIFRLPWGDPDRPIYVIDQDAYVTDPHGERCCTKADKFSEFAPGRVSNAAVRLELYFQVE